MISKAGYRTSRVGAALLILGLTLDACGGDESTPTVAAGQETTGSSEPATTLPATTSPTTGAPPTTTGRTPLTTTSLPAIADTAVDRTLIPEATASYELKPTTINGIQYANALRMASRKTPSKVEINAGRSRNRFLGSLGIPDDEKASTSVQVDISLDNGPAVFSTVVNFGETKKIDLDVTNVLRVRITVLVKNTDADSFGNYVAIGDPRFT